MAQLVKCPALVFSSGHDLGGRKGKTTLITAHRLSAVVHADLIIVMQNGTIIERGTHEELLQQKGWYYDTYQLQQLEAGLEAERNGK